MKACSVAKRIRIAPGDISDYRRLACYHYRGDKLTAYAAVFAMRLGTETVGVIVYTMPAVGAELRSVATGNLFAGFDRRTRLSLINKNIRTIARVIIEPRFCGIGLASRLVRETMPKMNVPIVEALAVMGTVNPFFEKAGMKAFAAKTPARCVQLVEALSLVGIEQDRLTDPQKMQRTIDTLDADRADFIERQMQTFLQSYGKRRDMQPGLERTRFVLSRLTERPVYYIWFNNKMELKSG